jgi:hypothetical protein
MKSIDKQIKELRQALTDAAVKSALLRAHAITLKATNPEDTTLSDTAEGIKNDLDLALDILNGGRDEEVCRNFL